MRGLKKCFSGAALKTIAVVTMAIDHTAAVLIANGVFRYVSTYALSSSTWETLRSVYYIMRSIGRCAFPIFAFLLVEGFFHTRDRKKYALRLFLFALVSEVPFDLAVSMEVFAPKKQNVMFTFLLAFLMMWVLERFKRNQVWYWLIAAAFAAAAQLMHTDYRWTGILVVLAYYTLRSEAWYISLIAGYLPLSVKNTWAFLGAVPLAFYNGERGRQNKYFFYVFYPAHLLLLWAIVWFLIRPMGL